MKNLVLMMMFAACITTVYATEYDIDLTKNHPQCSANSYQISNTSTRQEILKNCNDNILDTHNARVRLLRGSETIDLNTVNMGKISCKFSRSAINSNGSIKSCSSVTAPADKQPVVTVKAPTQPAGA